MDVGDNIEDNLMNLRFTNIKHVLGEMTLLSPKFVSAETPKGLKTELYPHQKTLVKAILDLEEQRYITVSLKKNLVGHLTNNPNILEYNSIVLSEPFGSGKTIIILAVILSNQIPKPISETVNICKCSSINNLRFTTTVTKKYNRILRPNLIIVGRSVLDQWVDAIKMFTNLKLLVVSDVYSLKKFYDYFKRNIIHYFDIILIKNGDVTPNFLLDGESKVSCHIRNIINIIAKISKSCVWSRVIYDDFDSISIPFHAVLIGSLFNIFVSATIRTKTFKKSKPEIYENMIDRIVNSSQVLMHDVLGETFLFSNLNLRNESTFTQQSINIPNINFYKYVYKNPDDNFLKLLDVMGENAIAEMLNGDAIETAAESLGIKSFSIADIFEKILGEKYKLFLHDNAIIKIIKSAIMYLERLSNDNKFGISPLMVSHFYSSDVLSKIETEIKHMRPINDMLLFRDNIIDEFLKQILDTYEESKRNNGLAINRVKDNIKAGECQICSLELKDFNVFINKCCGIILCDECAIKGSHLIKLTAKCPNCDADINFSKDVIFINQEFDINSIVEATGDEHEIKSSHVKDKENNVDPKINPKLKALLDIINGDPPVNKKTVDMSIKQLIIGKSILEPPKYRKVLVFANFNETLHNIEKTLDENSIKYLKLQGTHSKISTIISTFKNSNIHPTVLLINSSEHCAGLNLQFATDLIFFHKIINDNIESQVAGRAQRIGRTSNLNIHFLLYTNEK